MPGYTIEILLLETGVALLQEDGYYILLNRSSVSATTTSIKSTVGISERLSCTLLYKIPPDTSLCVDMKAKTVSAS